MSKPPFSMRLTKSRIIDGHDDEVISVAMSPSGSLVATGSYDGTARIWSVFERDCMRVIDIRSSYIGWTVFSHDGKLFATGSGGGAVRLWETTTWNKTCEFGELQGNVVFSEDATTVFFGGLEGPIRRFDLESHSERDPLFRGNTAKSFYCAEMSANGVFAVDLIPSDGVEIWSLVSGYCVGAIHRGRVIENAALSADGTLLAIYADDLGIELWAVPALTRIGTITTYSEGTVVGSVPFFEFSHFNTSFVTFGPAQRLRFWNVTPQAEIP